MMTRRRLLVALLLAAMTLPGGAAVAVEAEDDESVDEVEDDGGVPPPVLRIENVQVDEYPEVRLVTTVTAHPDGPLPASAFTVVEGGEERPAEVTYSDSSDLQVMLVIDTTGSMGGPPMAGAKSAASTFVNELAEDVALAILEYDAETQVVTDFDATREEHLDGINGLVADGFTAMFDAVMTAVETFPDDPDASRVIVLLTDGEDNASEHSVEEATDALVEAGVTLHSVEYLTAFTEGAAIRSMANATGGAVLRADDADALTEVYQRLAADLVSRYEVTYTSQATGRTDLEVRVDHDGMVASGRRTVTFPSTPRPDEAEDSEAAAVSGPTVTEPTPLPPTEASVGTRALLLGGALWFLALALAIFIFVAPRRRSAQLAGAGASLRGASGHRGVSRLADQVSLLADRSLERRGYRRGLSAALERAGIDLRPGEFVVLVVCAAFTAGAVGRLLHGWLLALLFAVVTIILSRLAVSILAERRQARFADQLGDTLQLLSGSLRAGYSLMQAVDSVAREAQSPSAEEFSRLVVETRLGRDMSEALHAMAVRMGSDDFAWVIQAIEIHREVGGDLAEVLDTVAGTIRERNQIRRQVKALSAEGRLSAYVLVALPFGVGGFIWMSNRPYLMELVNGGLLGWAMMAVGVVLLTIGVVWLRNIVRFRF